MVAAAVSAFVFLPLPGQIPVLMYHFIDTPERAASEKNVVSRKSFARQMAFLHRFGYHVISMDDYYAIKTGRKKPRGREIMITFDDGNYTFADQAYPEMAKYQFPVTLFVISQNIKDKSYGSMDEQTLKKLHSNSWITLGSHSRTHPLLSQLSDDAVRQELLGSKRELEDLFNTPFWYLAYPSGNMDERVTRIAEESGYRLAFTTSLKHLKDVQENFYSIPRVKISRTSDCPIAFWGQISGIYQAFKRLSHTFSGR